MFLGAVGPNVYPNDEDSESNPPMKRQVWEFLLMERLAPIPQSSHEWMVLVQGLIRVLLVPGSVAQEMLNRINESGGSDNPSTTAHYGPIRRDRQIPCTNNSLNQTREWYESKARTRGVSLSEVPPITMSSQARIEDDTFL
ncbi:hypothetical protein OG21DRAFT_1524947 [Imleria badia]|nr:hypothetical protein OG21DRAFT_1524947 [Imleria badia]